MRGASAVRGFGGVVGALVKTAGASVDGFREAAAASSAALRESSEDLQRTSAWVNAEVTGIATKAGEEIENLRRRRNAARPEGDDAAAEGGDPASESGSRRESRRLPRRVRRRPRRRLSRLTRRLARATDEERAERGARLEEDAAARREKEEQWRRRCAENEIGAGRRRLAGAQDEAGRGNREDGTRGCQAKENEGNRRFGGGCARLAERGRQARAEALARQAAARSKSERRGGKSETASAMRAGQATTRGGGGGQTRGGQTRGAQTDEAKRGQGTSGPQG